MPRNEQLEQAEQLAMEYALKFPAPSEPEWTFDQSQEARTLFDEIWDHVELSTAQRLVAEARQTLRIMGTLPVEKGSSK